MDRQVEVALWRLPVLPDFGSRMVGTQCDLVIETHLGICLKCIEVFERSNAGLLETPAASCRWVNEICRLGKVNERFEDPRDFVSLVNQVHC